MTEEPAVKKTYPGINIVGYNLAILIVYTLISWVAYHSEGWGLDCLLIAAHVVICLITSFVCVFILKYKKLSGFWLLSAFIVLVIGFSTCVASFNIKI